VTIKELTELVAEVTGFQGRITWDATKPDGTPRKLVDVSRLSALGWKAKVALREGVERTYASYRAEKASGRLRA
jgi:GDP-L-fucose synthase